MVIEEAEASADDGFRSSGPGKADSRRNVVRFLERGIIVPPNAAIQREGARNLPVVLNPEAVVVVAQLDFVGIRGEASYGCEEEEA